MKLPLEWLRVYCAPDLDADALADRLAMTGTEIGGVLHHGVGSLDEFIVGRVLTAEKHPDADRLTVCTVAVGEGDVAQIVCGAPNVAQGQTVAVARPGAVMPDGTTLGKAKLRGIASEGMILAEDELGIGTLHAGIMVLDAAPLQDATESHEGVVGLVPGTPLAEVLPIATDVLELEITPNRPDCLAVYGTSREVHAATGAPLAPPPWAEDPGTAGSVDVAEVVVETPLCPRFTARAFEDVSITESPPWLKARLMAAGQRPINNVVDITNYAMLLTGQPLHAFDLDRVAGGRLVVRQAKSGERMTTLDDVERVLDPDMVIIEDAEGPTSIAGVMGGARSEVVPETTRVLMEAASWIGPNIHATSTKLGLRTEASGRFEKGLSPEQAMEGQIVATRLMLELTGARLVGGTIDAGSSPPPPLAIHVREARVRALLGVDVPLDRQAEVLEALGFGVTPTSDGLEVAVPHWRRFDVTREADVIEEIARLAAIEDLPATLPARRGATGRLTLAQRARRRAEDVLVGRGLYGIAGWSFAAPSLLAKLRLDEPLVALENPMSEEESILRPTLLGSLLHAARHNRAHGAHALALFESGHVYRPGTSAALGVRPAPADERDALGAVVIGPLEAPTWRTPQPRAADVFTAKALAGAVLDALRVEWEAVPGTRPFLHPGRAAVLRAGGVEIGWFGELHPLVAREWDIEDAVAAFELELDPVLALVPEAPQYRDVTSFPPVRQDLAVVVGADVAAADVVRVVREAGGETLRSVRVFDRYAMDDRVSLALHLEFAAPDRTLTDEEVARVRETIVARLADELGAELRG
jgi:phenylalanyl-tRNA synthetase beta chain